MCTSTHTHSESQKHTLCKGGGSCSSRQGLESYCDFILLKTVDTVFSYMVIWLKSILAFLNFVHGWIKTFGYTTSANHLSKSRYWSEKNERILDNWGKWEFLNTILSLLCLLTLNCPLLTISASQLKLVQHDPGDHHKIKFKQIKTYTGRT